MIFLFLLGVALLAVMALAAHSMAYFPGDLTISHAVQAYHSDWLDRVLGAVSWLGFPPQSVTWPRSPRFSGFWPTSGIVACGGRLPVAAVAVLLVVMSFARVYSGHHWASDVFAGCLLGGLWLGVVVRLYTWGEARLAQRSQQATVGRPRRRAGRTAVPQAESTGQGARNQPQAS